MSPQLIARSESLLAAVAGELWIVFVTAEVVREMKGVFVDGWTLRTGEHHSFAVRSVDVTHHVRTAVERLEAVLTGKILGVAQQ